MIFSHLTLIGEALKSERFSPSRCLDIIKSVICLQSSIHSNCRTQLFSHTVYCMKQNVRNLNSCKKVFHISSYFYVSLLCLTSHVPSANILLHFFATQLLFNIQITFKQYINQFAHIIIKLKQTEAIPIQLSGSQCTSFIAKNNYSFQSKKYTLSICQQQSTLYHTKYSFRKFYR